MKDAVCALTVAGSDSGGGAGVQADLKTFSALGVFGVCAITSITAQNTIAITAIQDVRPDIVKAQIDAVVQDIGVDAAKIGMLHTIETIETVAEQMDNRGFPTVVDPVMVSKDGTRLLEKNAVKTLVKSLIPLATVVTPNAIEAELLSGIKIRNLDDAKVAAKEISRLGPKAVIVKGGHISGDKAIDVLFYEDKFKLFETERIKTTTTHGTGCTFSSAIAAELAKGNTITEAVQVAKDFVTRGIKFGLPIGQGHGPVNPMAIIYNDAKKYYVIKQIKDAIEILESHPEVSNIIPESQTNIVMALPYATDYNDVAGVSGRIVKIGDRVRASSCPEFGTSKHVSKTVLVAMRHDQSVCAAMNVCYSEELIDVCNESGLSISSYDRREEPLEVKKVEGMSTSWGAEQAIKRIGKVPNVIYHTGDWGKEPMIILLGKTAIEVADVAVKIARELRKKRS